MMTESSARIGDSILKTMDESKRMKTLMLRLEAAVTRLEDVAETRELFNGSSSGQLSLEKPESAASVAADKNTSTVDSPLPVETLSQALAKFDDLKSIHLDQFLALSKQVGGPALEQALLLEACHSAQRNLIYIASRCVKPPANAAGFLKLLEPLQKALASISDVKDKNRASPLFNHLSTVADGVGAVGWVTVEPAPAAFVGDMKDSAQFYANRVIKQYKDTDSMHVDWARSFLSLLSELQIYVKEFHTTGLSWAKTGSDISSISIPNADSSSQKDQKEEDKNKLSGPPAPPGPPPPPLMNFNSDAVSTQGDMNSVFADLNRGSSVTAGLKKVDKTQMTHKNTALRQSSVVPAGNKPAPSTKPAALTKQFSYKKKASRKELEGSKWIIENFEDNHNIILENVQLNQSVYVYNCKNCTIQIKGKFNALSLDDCEKTGIVVDILVSAIDLVRTKSFALQILDRCPTVICDVCESGQIYLSKTGLDCEVVTSKCGSININLPTQDGDFREEAVPEMLKHNVVNGKLVSSIVVHAD